MALILCFPKSRFWATSFSEQRNRQLGSRVVLVGCAGASFGSSFRSCWLRDLGQWSKRPVRLVTGTTFNSLQVKEEERLAAAKLGTVSTHTKRSWRSEQTKRVDTENYYKVDRRLGGVNCLGLFCVRQNSPIRPNSLWKSIVVLWQISAFYWRQCFVVEHLIPQCSRWSSLAWGLDSDSRHKASLDFSSQQNNLAFIWTSAPPFLLPTPIL